MSKQNLGPVVVFFSLLALIATTAVSVQAADRVLETERMLTWADQQNLNTRSLDIPDSKTHVWLWDERTLEGDLVPFYAISLDGSRIDVARRASYTLELRYGSFDPLVSIDPASMNDQAIGFDMSVYIVQFFTPPIEAYREAIRASGGTIYKYLPNYAYLVHLDSEARRAVGTLEFVRWVGPFHSRNRIDDRIYQTVLSDDSSGDESSAIYTIQVFERGSAQKQVVAQYIEQMGGKIEHLIPDGFLLRASLTPGQITSLARRNEVASVEPWGPPEEDMNIARQIGNADYVETLGFTGQGVRAEVMDGNIRDTHVDFQDPPALYHGSHSGSSSHGTSTYGIVFGTGTGQAMGMGMLPDAEAKIFADYDHLSNRYTHTARLTDPDDSYRAVFQSNSWGSPRTTTYTSVSMEMDDILLLNDIIICQSQSNSGGTPSRPQAWAKNIVAVGGVYHYNTLSKSDDRWNYGASTGPASDGRVKPDQTHFYDQVYCPYYTSDTAYTSGFNGTSAATPINAGYYGLLFQMWHEEVFPGRGGNATVFDSKPHMSTAKAMMLCSSEQYSIAGTDLTRFRQGWGMVDIGYLYDMRNNMFIIDEDEVMENFDMKNYEFEVSSGEPQIKITMVYTDTPGVVGASKHRINDLSLSVTSPSGVRYWGNNGLEDDIWSSAGGSANDIDTVENVFIENPEAGTWTIEVWASEINEDSHLETPEVDADFALVAIGGTGQEGMTLNHSPLVGGEQASFRVANATPDSPVYLLYSLSGFGSTWIPGMGVMVDLESPRLAGDTIANGSGIAELFIDIPDRATGRTVYMQAIEAGRKSNTSLSLVE